MEAVAVENLSFTYPDRRSKALDNINLSIKSGELILLCGESGCGKTTLLRLLKKEISPHGSLTGTIRLNGIDIEEMPQRESVSQIGFVMQNPEQQIVTETVWRELAFGLESLSLDRKTIRRRTAETAAYFGIEKLYHCETATLSGGEKQLVNLASVMAMNPNILILDEPTSQLDPIAAREFVGTVSRLNREWGITVIISEHRTEELFGLADRVVVMENGTVICDGTPRKVGMSRCGTISRSFPVAVNLYRMLGGKAEERCPLSVRECRNMITCNIRESNVSSVIEQHKMSTDIAVELKNISFRYTRSGSDILNRTDLKIYSGEIYSVLGGNGAGKSTLLGVISGLKKPYSGTVKILNKPINKYNLNSLYVGTLALLPQNPQELFIKNSLKEDYDELKASIHLSDDDFAGRLGSLCSEFGIEKLLDFHPYDLSGGELQKAALVKLLLLNPKIILLDEPTKGMDGSSKYTLAKLLKNLKHRGVTVLLVTHDAEFAAVCSDRCGLLFDGEIVSEDNPQSFFAQNTYYTTSAAKISKGIFENTVTLEQLYTVCKENGVCNV